MAVNVLSLATLCIIIYRAGRRFFQVSILLELLGNGFCFCCCLLLLLFVVIVYCVCCGCCCRHRCSSAVPMFSQTWYILYQFMLIFLNVVIQFVVLETTVCSNCPSSKKGQHVCFANLTPCFHVLANSVTWRSYAVRRAKWQLLSI